MTAPDPSEATVLLRDTGHLCRVLGVAYSPEQLAAITGDPRRPSRIAAGAGSGKTEVMAARVVWLVGRGHLRPDAVLGLTFTNKAAGELAGRIRRALGLLGSDAGIPGLLEQHGEPTISTYHAYAGALLTEYGPRLGVEPDLQVVSDASCYQRAARAAQTYPGTLALTSTHMPRLVQDIVALDGQLSEHLVDPARLRSWDENLVARLTSERQVADVRKAAETARQRIELSHLVERYRAAKVDAGVMDFADQMAWGARLGLECPEVSGSERERYAVVLLDEYQDTSVAQRRMLQGLFSGEDVEHGRGHPVTAVGDVCQAIYGWRGASADNLTGFLDHFPPCDEGPGAAHRLTVNRRCATSVLAVANQLVSPLHSEHAIAEPLRARPDSPAGEVRAACLTTVADEVDWVAQQVDEVGRTAAGEDGRPSAWSDIAVLVRDKSEIGALAAALRDRDVPVEVVGMSGLLRQPEVSDVVATLEVVDSPTANPSLLRLLTGPRWSIGARDLAILGTRARQLASGTSAPPGSETTLDDQLARAVDGVDPTEVLSLADAVEDPGPLAYSDQARERFAELSAMVTRLRRHVGEPLSDLTRRVITALDLDVELATQEGPAARQAQDNLALLVEAVEGFVGADGRSGLTGLLAYLRAEEEHNDGMEVAAPSDRDSVKLLTAHRAKGLEWTYVFVPFMSEDVFPSGRGRDRWTSRAKELPGALRGDAADQPTVEQWTPKGLGQFAEQVAGKARREETRLAYVALTRARRLLVVSGHWWGRSQKKPRGPSDYLVTVRDWLRRNGADAVEWAADPRQGQGQVANPMLATRAPQTWPQPAGGDRVERRRQVARQLRERMDGDADPAPVPLDEVVARTPQETRDLERLHGLDADVDRLVAEAQEGVRDPVYVDMPPSLSATALARLREDPRSFARDLARPMPRRPRPTARFGTRFHAWVESHFGQQPLLDEAELPGRDETDIDDDTELRELIEAFRAGPYAERVPYQMEAPFTLRLAGQQVRGRIDAVYQTPDGFEVVDWKTNRAADADPVQLAVYRLAWAEMHDLDPTCVRAAFYYVRLDKVVSYGEEHDDLPGRAELERMVEQPQYAPYGREP